MLGEGTDLPCTEELLTEFTISVGVTLRGLLDTTRGEGRRRGLPKFGTAVAVATTLLVMVVGGVAGVTTVGDERTGFGRIRFSDVGWPENRLEIQFRGLKLCEIIFSEGKYGVVARAPKPCSLIMQVIATSAGLPSACANWEQIWENLETTSIVLY